MHQINLYKIFFSWVFMKSLFNILSRKDNRVDSPENFAKASWLFNRFLTENGLTVGFKGNYQINSSLKEKPGPKFPFLMGFDEIGLKELEKGKIDAITASPASCLREYEGKSLSYIQGKIDQKEMFFTLVLPEREIKAFKEIEFEGHPNLSPENSYYHKKEFQGFSTDPSSTNPKGRVYKGEFRKYYPNEPAIQREGIFQLERVI